MEIYKKSCKGRDVYVIFSGGIYVFWNPYYGFFAYAERTTLEREKGTEFFTLTWGNRHAVGSSFESYMESFAKRFVRNAEREHGATTVDFEVHERPLDDAYLSLADGVKFPR